MKSGKGITLPGEQPGEHDRSAKGHLYNNPTVLRQKEDSVLALNKKRGIEIPLAFLHFAAL
jgi:hypothetical protein